MKKSLIALAALAAVSAASAQSSVTISGGIGFDYAQSNTGAKGFENADAGSTNIAFKATEDLGGGLKVTAYMQQRFNATNGANANSSLSTVANGRELQNVYLEAAGGFGTVRFGRILMSNQGDAFGQFGTNSDAGFGDIDNTGNRHDNTVAYYSPSVQGFALTVAATVNGQTAAGVDNVTKEYSYVQLKYSNGPVMVSYAEDKNAKGVAGVVNKTFAATYDLKMAKVFLTNGDANGVKNTSVGVNVPMGNITYKAMTVSGDSDNVLVVGADYRLSKRTYVFADLADTKDAAKTAYRIGVMHSF
jgi:predicted porin